MWALRLRALDRGEDARDGLIDLDHRPLDATGCVHVLRAAGDLRDRPAVVAPIASATSLEQLRSLIRDATLKLSPDEIAALG